MFIWPFCIVRKRKVVVFVVTVFGGGVFFLWSNSFYISLASNKTDKAILEASIILPYHPHLAPEPVVQIAEATAILYALDQARDTFSEMSLVKLGVRSREGQLALASAVYSISICERSIHDGPKIFIKVSCYPQKSGSPEECMRKLLRQPEHLQLRELAIKKLEECINEGKDILDQSCNCKSILYSQSPSILSQVKSVSNRIKALQLYFVELNNFEFTWTKPDQTVLTLSEATTLDPDNTLLWLGVGECLVLLHRPYEGIKVLQKISSDSELPARLLYMRGMASLQMYLPALAIKDISHALELEPEHSEWWRALGVAKLVAGETKDMCNDFYKACAMGNCEGLEEMRRQHFCLEYTGL